jgi:pyruvate formate lyase activating enzyme
MNKESEIEGVIFRIKRFSVHDGPGIRTTVFLKGCALNCIWCHSPEGIDQKITIWYNQNLCIGCGKCTISCPESALTLYKDKKSYIEINRSICNVSGNCVEACPTRAIEFTGVNTNVSNVVSEIEKDKTFYDNSGGGLTLSGGEPLFQPEFSEGILKACKERNIHTAIETSLFCETSAIDSVSEYVDLFICDLKILNSSEHKLYTGKPNNTILENFRYIAAKGKDIIVRIPMVERITDTEGNLNDISAFVKEIRSDIKIEKVPFNPLAENNYKKLGIPFLLK